MNIDKIKHTDYSFDMFELHPNKVGSNEYEIQRLYDVIDNIYIQGNFDKTKLEATFLLGNLYEEVIDWNVIKSHYGNFADNFKNLIPLCFSFCIDRNKFPLIACLLCNAKIKINIPNCKIFVKGIFLNTDLRRKMAELGIYTFKTFRKINENDLIYKILENKFGCDITFEILKHLVFIKKNKIHLN